MAADGLPDAAFDVHCFLKVINKYYITRLHLCGRTANDGKNKT